MFIKIFFLKMHEIVLDFIHEKQLILVGGQATHYALNETLYDKNEIPDLDFYSPTPIIHAHELAEKLPLEVRVFNALHPTTMKIRDMEDNDLADITYIPPQLDIPYICRSIGGRVIRIIDPIFSKLDKHLSLSLPMAGVPKETVFHRLDKDLERLKLLDDQFPEPEILSPSDFFEIKIDKEIIYSGAVAYGIIENSFPEYCDKKLTKMKGNILYLPKDLLPFKQMIAVYSLPENGVPYAPYLEYISQSVEDKLKKYFIIDNSFSWHPEYYVMNVQTILVHLLANYYLRKKQMFISMYTNLKRMISKAEENIPFDEDMPFYINMHLLKAPDVPRWDRYIQYYIVTNDTMPIYLRPEPRDGLGFDIKKSQLFWKGHEQIQLYDYKLPSIF